MVGWHELKAIALRLSHTPVTPAAVAACASTSGRSPTYSTACLSALHVFRLAVIGNGDQSQQEAKLRRTGLSTYFEAVLTLGRPRRSQAVPRGLPASLRVLGRRARHGSPS